MLNQTSRRSETHADVFPALLRPLATALVIALTLAATAWRPAEALSRERAPRRSASTHLQLQPVRRKAHSVARRETASRVARRGVQRHFAGESSVNVRGRRRSMNAVYSGRPERRGALHSRSSRARMESVVFTRRSIRPSMARPVPGANSLIEAAPGSMDTGQPRPDGRAADAGTPGGALPAASANELAEAAIQPHVFPEYTRNGRLIVPPPLRGSREILVHQNQMADAAGLERIENDEELDRLRYTHQLVEVGGPGLTVNPELPENRRFARPWTAKFASDIARAYYARFGQPLELNSAVRTISYQLRLQHVNGNAAAIEGETASPHLTGQAIDFGKREMTMAEIAWMRLYLEPFMQAGMIDVEEEFQQACFHISVYRTYSGNRTADLAQVQDKSRNGLPN